MAICGVTHPEARSAEKNSLLCLALGDFVRKRMREVGVVHRIGVRRPEVIDLIASSLQEAFNFLLELEASVVRCDENFHWNQSGSGSGSKPTSPTPTHTCLLVRPLRPGSHH